MEYQKPEQQLVSFTGSYNDMKKIRTYLSKGWHIVTLVKNRDYYTGILEKPTRTFEDGSVFIPPRKKIQIL